jgi:hypothetical protein
VEGSARGLILGSLVNCIGLKRRRETCQDNYLQPGPLEYEAGTLTTWPWRSVRWRSVWRQRDIRKAWKGGRPSLEAAGHKGWKSHSIFISDSIKMNGRIERVTTAVPRLTRNRKAPDSNIDRRPIIHRKFVFSSVSPGNFWDMRARSLLPTSSPNAMRHSTRPQKSVNAVTTNWDKRYTLGLTEINVIR